MCQQCHITLHTDICEDRLTDMCTGPNSTSSNEDVRAGEEEGGAGVLCRREGGGADVPMKGWRGWGRGEGLVRGGAGREGRWSG